MSDRDVSEFVILSPAPCHSALVYSRQRLQKYLEAHFPQYCFSLAECAAEMDDNEFVVVPVVGSVGDEFTPGRRYEVDDSVIAAIREALEAFELRPGLLH